MRLFDSSECVHDWIGCVCVKCACSRDAEHYFNDATSCCRLCGATPQGRDHVWDYYDCRHCGAKMEKPSICPYCDGWAGESCDLADQPGPTGYDTHDGWTGHRGCSMCAAGGLERMMRVRLPRPSLEHGWVVGSW